MARRSTSTAYIQDEEDNVLRFDAAAADFLDSDGAIDDVDHKVKAAQERLTLLRQEQEEIEREKKHLEELRQKQERFASGKREVLEKLARTTSGLERELYEAQKLVEEISLTRDTFVRHLEALRQLQPEKWARTQVDQELDNALAAIEDAEDDYSKGVRRINACRRSEAALLQSELEAETPAGTSALPFAGDDPAAWMRRGFAFTLPLIGALLVGLILARLMF